MNNKKEQIPATKAIAEIKEQVQLDRWKKDIENRQAALPILLRATLIPFKDKIIYDSIVTCSNVILGRGYAETFKNIYLLAKQAKTIHTSL